MLKEYYLKYRKHIPVSVFIISILLILIPSPGGDNAFSINSNTQIISLGVNTSQATINEVITASVVLNTRQQDINTVGIVINYDPTILSIQSVDTSTSFCTFYADRTYNEQKGQINLYCGKPNPGFNGENVLETINFKAITYGKTNISVDPKSLVLLNDGKGTNILKDFEKKQILVILSQ